MRIDQFERELRALLRASPFQPFTIVMEGGRTLFVDEPAVSFGGGSAGFIDANSDAHLFKCQEVREFRRSNEELAL